MSQTKIDIGMISTTGTASSSTFLRGDNAWTAVTNPAITYVSSATASSRSSIEFTGLDNSADCWIVRWTGLHLSAWGNVAIRTSDDASSHSYENGASDYSWVVAGGYPSATFTSGQHWDSADTMIKCGHDPVYINVANNDASSGMCYIWNPADTTYYKHITGTSYNQNDGGTAYASFSDFQGVRRSTNAVTAVQFFHSQGGNFDAGKFVLYKWLHS